MSNDEDQCTSMYVTASEESGLSGWWNLHPHIIALKWLFSSDGLFAGHHKGFTKVNDLSDQIFFRIYSSA